MSLRMVVPGVITTWLSVFGDSFLSASAARSLTASRAANGSAFLYLLRSARPDASSAGATFRAGGGAAPETAPAAPAGWLATAGVDAFVTGASCATEASIPVRATRSIDSAVLESVLH